MPRSSEYKGKRIAKKQKNLKSFFIVFFAIILLGSFLFAKDQHQASAISPAVNSTTKTVMPELWNAATNDLPNGLSVFQNELSTRGDSLAEAFTQERLRLEAEAKAKRLAEIAKAKKIAEAKARAARLAELKAREVKILTWNVCSQFCPQLASWQKTRGKQLVVRALEEKPDVIILQETGHEDRELKTIQAALGSDWDIASYKSSKVIFYNNKTISRKDSKGEILPAGFKGLTARGDTRWATYATLRPIGSKSIFTVGNFHLKSSREDWKTRDAQFKIAMAELEKYPGTKIFGGDLNSYGPIKTSKERMGVHSYAHAKKYFNAVSLAANPVEAFKASYVTTNDSPSGSIGKHLDHFYVPEGVKVTNWKLSHANGASDHRFVVASVIVLK